MATIAAPSDFVGMIFIAQVNAPVDIGPSQVFPVQGALQSLIDTKEPEVLIELLGYSLYSAFQAARLNPPMDQRWLDLQFGKTYADERGITRVYTGLKPIITRFVYYWYLRQEVTNTNGVGESINDTENSTRTSPAQKMATAWNDMVKLVQNCYGYIHANTALYPEAPDFNTCYGGCFDRILWEGYYRYWRRCNLLSPINTLSI